MGSSGHNWIAVLNPKINLGLRWLIARGIGDDQFSSRDALVIAGIRP